MEHTTAFPSINILLTDKPAKPVQLVYCPVTLNPLTPDTRITILQFDPATKQFAGKINATAYGPILFDNKEMVEVHRSCQDTSGSHTKEIHWLGVFDNKIHLRMRDIPDEYSASFKERIDLVDMSFPVCPDVSQQLSRTVCYFQGDYRAEEHFTDTFSGVFDLQINDTQFDCLKMTTVREHTPDRSVETFIDTNTGRVVYTQTLTGNKVVSFQLIIHY